MAGRHRLKVDRSPLYRWILATSSLGILAANLLVIPTDQPPPPTPVIAAPTPVTTHTPLPSTSFVPTTSPPPPPPPTTTTTTTPPPETTTTTTPPKPTKEAKSRILDKPDECDSHLAGTVDYVAQAGHYIMLRFGILESLIGGRAPRANKSDHPSGHALDFSVNRITGDQLAEYALDNAKLLSVKYVIWRQRIRFPGGDWKRMKDRGSPTANHYDHVHISFLSKKTGNPTC